MGPARAVIMLSQGPCQARDAHPRAYLTALARVLVADLCASNDWITDKV